MKKVLIIVGSVIALILILLITLPFMFKGKIIEIVKEQANENLNAKVDFGEFDLSIFQNFPDFTFKIEDVKVVGIDTFQSVTLAEIGLLEVSMDLMSVMSGDQIKINTVGIADLTVHAIVLKDSTANWDIAKSSGETEVEEPEAEDTGDGKFNIKLKKFYLENINVIYDDQPGGMYAEIKNLNFTLKGDFSQDIFDLFTQTDIEELTYIMDGVKMVNKAKLGMKFDLGMDMPNAKYTFKENEVSINELTLAFDGWVAMPGDDIDMDIKFNTNKPDFKTLLSLVPAIYTQDFASVKTTGTLALNGMAKGVYNDKQLPNFDLNLAVDNASLKYPDLPKSVENIRIKVNVNNPGGSEDKTVINISDFHLEMAENPVDIKLRLSTPISDPNIKCSIKSQINLENVKDFMPVEEGESYNGSITADIDLVGRLSAIENEQYDQFDARGQLIILGMNYKSPEMGYDVNLESMYLNFSPQNVGLTAFKSKIGKSDIAADGTIDNLLAYYFKDETLSGTFNIQSNLLDINELMGPEEEVEEEEAATAPADTTSEPMEVVDVPTNIDFRMTTDIKKLIYDNMDITNIKGGVSIKDGVVSMDNLGMNMLDGSINLSGSYSTQKKLPEVDFKMDISKIDIEKTVKTFNTVKEMAPISENAKGRISTGLTFAGQLDSKMEPIMNSLAGNGKLTTHNVIIGGSKTMLKIGEAIKSDKLKEIELNNVDIYFKFKDGKVDVEPFDVKISKSVATIYGSHYFTNEMDYKMDLDAHTDDLGGAGVMMQGMLSQASAFGINAKMPERIKLKIGIGGTVDDPKITTAFGDMASSAKESAKEAVKEKVEEVVKEKVEEVKKDVKKEAREQAAKLIKQAEGQAAKIRAEAKKLSEVTKKEGYAAADKVENSASNAFAKIAAKKTAQTMRKETDKKAKKIVTEADKKANAIIAAAKAKAAAMTK